MNYRPDEVWNLTPSQAQLLELPWAHPGIGEAYMVGGYGSAKSTALAMLATRITQKYWDYPLTGGMGSTTITLAEKTVIPTTLRLMRASGMSPEYKRGVISVGRHQIDTIGTWVPSRIYGNNWSYYLGDELDELEQSVSIEADKSVHERCRVPFPDGRRPLVVQATTAQGLRGLYRLVETAREKKRPHVLIRARTRDNPANPPEYVADLESRYTPDEIRAYLNGEFINLTAGRVYYAYNEAEHMRTLAPVEPGETVYVGQDLNEGYSRGVAGVVRENRLEIVAEYSFREIGWAPRLLREAFPRNRIVWIPDNSGRPILGGYAEEVDHYGIETVYTGRNPIILDRVFATNKLLGAGRMLIHTECRELSMAAKTRQYDDKGKPEKGKGERAPDHICDAWDYLVFRLISDHEAFADLWGMFPGLHREREE